MREKMRAFDVLEELHAQAMPEMRALDQARNIRNDEGALRAWISHADHAEIGFECRKRIVGNLGPRRGDARNEGRLSGIWKSDKPNIGQELQFQAQTPLFTGKSVLVFGRRLMRGGGVSRVAFAAFAAAGNNESIPSRSEVVKNLARIGIVNDRADRGRHFNGIAIAALAIAAFAVTPAFRLVLGIETKMEERVVVLACDENHVTAAAAVAAARSASRNELLASKRKTTVAAVPSADENFYFIYKHSGRTCVGEQEFAALSDEAAGHSRIIPPVGY
jgi:hypothetical protein